MGNRRASRAACLVTAVVAALVLPAPAFSQSEPGYLRSGTWLGEFITFADLTGSTQGANAVYSGHIKGQVLFDIDDGGTIATGDWGFDGSAVMEFTGSLTGTITHAYDATGTITGDSHTLTLSGSNTTSGTFSSQGQFVSVPGQTSSVSIPDIALTPTGCNEVDGDILPPLDMLAQDSEWTGRDIDGFMFATYAGDDTVDDLILAEIAALREQQEAWGDALITSGEVDLGTGATLVHLARDLGEQLVDAERCLYEEVGEPEDFTLLFALDMLADLYLAMSLHREMAGVDVQDAAMLLPMIGQANTMEVGVREKIGERVTTILDRDLETDRETCDPCLSAESGEDAVHAVLAAHTLGATEATVDGVSYPLGRIIRAIDVLDSAP